MRSSRIRKANPQDDGLKNSFDGIFRIDLHAAFAAPDEDENTYLNPSLRGASCATWQSLPST